MAVSWMLMVALAACAQATTGFLVTKIEPVPLLSSADGDSNALGELARKLSDLASDHDSTTLSRRNDKLKRALEGSLTGQDRRMIIRTQLGKILLKDTRNTPLFEVKDRLELGEPGKLERDYSTGGHGTSNLHLGGGGLPFSSGGFRSVRGNNLNSGGRPEGKSKSKNFNLDFHASLKFGKDKSLGLSKGGGRGNRGGGHGLHHGGFNDYGSGSYGSSGIGSSGLGSGFFHPTGKDFGNIVFDKDYDFGNDLLLGHGHGQQGYGSHGHRPSGGHGSKAQKPGLKSLLFGLKGRPSSGYRQMRHRPTGYGNHGHGNQGYGNQGYGQQGYGGGGRYKPSFKDKKRSKFEEIESIKDSKYLKFMQGIRDFFSGFGGGSGGGSGGDSIFNFYDDKYFKLSTGFDLSYGKDKGINKNKGSIIGGKGTGGYGQGGHGGQGGFGLGGFSDHGLSGGYGGGGLDIGGHGLGLGKGFGGGGDLGLGLHGDHGLLGGHDDFLLGGDVGHGQQQGYKRSDVDKKTPNRL